MIRLAPRHLVLAFGLCFVSIAALAAAPMSFEGKKIEMYIGSAPGGGTDLSSRLIGNALVKYLPGNPAIVYRNIPGAQGVKALNYFVSQVKPNGLAIAGGGTAHIDPGTLKAGAAQYDPLKFAYIGGLSRGGTIFVLRKDAVARLTDKSKAPVVVPALDGTSTGPQMALWGAEYLGWNVRFVLGHAGTSSMVMAARRGEADAMASSSALTLKPLLDDAAFVAIAQLGEGRDDGSYAGRNSFPDVPVFSAMIDSKLSGVDREAYLSWLAGQEIDKWFALPPETAADFVTAYGEAFRQAVVDPDFLRLGKAQLSDDVRPISGPRMTMLVDSMIKTSDIQLAHLLDMRRKFGIPSVEIKPAAAQASAPAIGLQVKTMLDAVENEGRTIVFKKDGVPNKAEISGSRTKIRVAGSDANRQSLKPGLQCDVQYASDGGEAAVIDCQ